MRTDLWEARASQLSSFSGRGLTIKEIAEQASLSTPTVKRYANLYGFEFGRYSAKVDHEKGLVSQGRIEAMRKCADAGKTRIETASELGLEIGTVYAYARNYNIQFVHGSDGRGVDLARAEVMASMYRAGKTLEEIGEIYSVSRERVRQIIKKRHGITAEDGGIRIRALARASKKSATLQAKCLKQFGCSSEQYKTLIKLGQEMRSAGISAYKTPTRAFVNQRNNAIGRGIEWKINLWEWWQFWQSSGKWDQRGRGADLYVMCRFADMGAYELGNIYIATLVHNSSVQPNNPYRKDHPRHDEVMKSVRARNYDRKSSAKSKYPSLPVGVTFHKKSGRFMAQISIDGASKYLGMFASPELAGAKYLAALDMIENPMLAAAQ